MHSGPPTLTPVDRNKACGFRQDKFVVADKSTRNKVCYRRSVQPLQVRVGLRHDKDIRNMRNVSEHLKTVAALHDVFSELTLLTKLFLVVPVSSATAERSFSAMRRLKTYLRSTMSTKRLNSVMTAHS